MKCEHDWRTKYAVFGGPDDLPSWHEHRLTWKPSMPEGRVCSKCHEWLIMPASWGEAPTETRYHVPQGSR